MKLAESRNHPYVYRIKLPIEGSEASLLYLHVKWTKSEEEPLDGIECRLISTLLVRLFYDDKDEYVISEVVASMRWSGQKSKKIFPPNGNPAAMVTISEIC